MIILPVINEESVHQLQPLLDCLAPVHAKAVISQSPTTQCQSPTTTPGSMHSLAKNKKQTKNNPALEGDINGRGRTQRLCGYLRRTSLRIKTKTGRHPVVCSGTTRSLSLDPNTSRGIAGSVGFLVGSPSVGRRPTLPGLRARRCGCACPGGLRMRGRRLRLLRSPLDQPGAIRQREEENRPPVGG